MIDFLVVNMAEVGTVVIALIIIIYALITKQWAVLRSSALSLMLAAEKLMATAEGKAKMDWVLVIVWDQAPKWVKKAYDKDKLRGKLQEWYNIARNMLK